MTEQRQKEINEVSIEFITNNEAINQQAGGDLDVLDLCIKCFRMGAAWSDDNPENAFTKPTAREFFNQVFLMRNNQRSFFELSRKKELTEEERALKQQYLRNSKDFEDVVDAVIAKTCETLKRMEGRQ